VQLSNSEKYSPSAALIVKVTVFDSESTVASFICLLIDLVSKNSILLYSDPAEITNPFLLAEPDEPYSFKLPLASSVALTFQPAILTVGLSTLA
jgi:hypothetical protein